MAGWTGLEPATSGVTGRHSNQLNYHPINKYTSKIIHTFYNTIKHTLSILLYQLTQQILHFYTKKSKKYSPSKASEQTKHTPFSFFAVYNEQFCFDP